VQVHRFITRGTFEERINEMIRSKRALAEMAVGTGETWVGKLPPPGLVPPKASMMNAHTG